MNCLYMIRNKCVKFEQNCSVRPKVIRENIDIDNYFGQ